MSGAIRFGHDVAEHDLAVAGAEGAGGHGEVLLAQAQGFAAHDAGEVVEVGDGDGDDDVAKPGAEDGDDGHGQDDDREGPEESTAREMRLSTQRP